MPPALTSVIATASVIAVGRFVYCRGLTTTRVYQWKFTGCYLAAGCAASGSERSRINNSLLLRDLLVAGLGIGALRSFLADPAIARGERRRVLPAFMDEPRQVEIV